MLTYYVLYINSILHLFATHTKLIYSNVKFNYKFVIKILLQSTHIEYY